MRGCFMGSFASSQRVRGRRRGCGEHIFDILVAEGERRLEQLLVEEQATPSPFTAPPGPPAVLTVPAEVSRLQAIIDSLQEKFSQLRVGVVRSTAMDEDDDNTVDLPHKKSRVSPVTPLAITGGRAPQTPPATTGGHGKGSTQSR